MTPAASARVSRVLFRVALIDMTGSLLYGTPPTISFEWVSWVGCQPSFFSLKEKIFNFYFWMLKISILNIKLWNILLAWAISKGCTSVDSVFVSSAFVSTSGPSLPPAVDFGISDVVVSPLVVVVVELVVVVVRLLNKIEYGLFGEYIWFS